MSYSTGLKTDLINLMFEGDLGIVEKKKHGK